MTEKNDYPLVKQHSGHQPLVVNDEQARRAFNKFVGAELLSSGWLEHQLELEQTTPGQPALSVAQQMDMLRDQLLQQAQAIIPSSEHPLLTRSMKDILEEIRTLSNQLNCQAYQIEQSHPAERGQLIAAVDQAQEVKQLLLSFSKNGQPCSLVLERDSNDQWSVVEGSAKANRTLESLLEEYLANGPLQLIAHQTLANHLDPLTKDKLTKDNHKTANHSATAIITREQRAIAAQQIERTLQHYRDCFEEPRKLLDNSPKLDLDIAELIKPVVGSAQNYLDMHKSPQAEQAKQAFKNDFHQVMQTIVKDLKLLLTEFETYLDDLPPNNLVLQKCYQHQRKSVPHLSKMLDGITTQDYMDVFDVICEELPRVSDLNLSKDLNEFFTKDIVNVWQQTFQQLIPLADYYRYQYSSNPETIAATAGQSFFRQLQNGPYCQTVATNNFIGDDVVTPYLLNNKLDLWHSMIMHSMGSEFGTSERLELFSRWRHELQQTQKSLGLLKNQLLLDRMQKVSVEIETLINELECKACQIALNDTKQIKIFNDAAKQGDINRLLLAYQKEKGGHIIALRRNPQQRDLWIIIDSNKVVDCENKPLQNILQSYNSKSELKIICHKNLFASKAGRQIPSYTIDYLPEEQAAVLNRPSEEQLAQWCVEDRTDRDFTLWDYRHSVRRISADLNSFFGHELFNQSMFVGNLSFQNLYKKKDAFSTFRLVTLLATQATLTNEEKQHLHNVLFESVDSLSTEKKLNYGFCKIDPHKPWQVTQFVQAVVQENLEKLMLISVDNGITNCWHVLVRDTINTQLWRDGGGQQPSKPLTALLESYSMTAPIELIAHNCLYNTHNNIPAYRFCCETGPEKFSIFPINLPTYTVLEAWQQPPAASDAGMRQLVQHPLLGQEISATPESGDPSQITTLNGHAQLDRAGLIPSGFPGGGFSGTVANRSTWSDKER